MNLPTLLSFKGVEIIVARNNFTAKYAPASRVALLLLAGCSMLGAYLDLRPGSLFSRSTSQHQPDFVESIRENRLERMCAAMEAFALRAAFTNRPRRLRCCCRRGVQWLVVLEI